MRFLSIVEGVSCLPTPPELILKPIWLRISEGQGYYYQHTCRGIWGGTHGAQKVLAELGRADSLMG